MTIKTGESYREKTLFFFSLYLASLWIIIIIRIIVFGNKDIITVLIDSALPSIIPAIAGILVYTRKNFRGNLNKIKKATSH